MSSGLWFQGYWFIGVVKVRGIPVYRSYGPVCSCHVQIRKQSHVDKGHLKRTHGQQWDSNEVYGEQANSEIKQPSLPFSVQTFLLTWWAEFGGRI